MRSYDVASAVILYILRNHTIQDLLVTSTLTLGLSDRASEEKLGVEWVTHKRFVKGDQSSKKSTKNKSQSCKDNVRSVRQRLFDIATLISSSESLNDPSSPQRKALEWLLIEDTLKGCEHPSRIKTAKTIHMHRKFKTNTNKNVDGYLLKSTPAALKLIRDFQSKGPTYNKSSKKSKQEDKKRPWTYDNIRPFSSSTKSGNSKSFKKTSSTARSDKKIKSTNKASTSDDTTLKGGTNERSKGSKNASYKGIKGKMNQNNSSIDDVTPNPLLNPDIGSSSNCLLDQVDAILQRYALGVFYFSTHGDETWERCGRNSKMPCDLIGAGKVCLSNGRKSSWLSESHECDWGGVECKSSKWIQKIDFGTSRIIP